VKNVDTESKAVVYDIGRLKRSVRIRSPALDNLVDSSVRSPHSRDEADAYPEKSFNIFDV